MITIPRAVARQLAKVFRIALALTPAQAARQPVSIDSDEQGVTFFSQTKEFGISYRLPGASTRERIVVPLGLFRAIGGECPDPVTIKRARNQVIKAQWQDGDVPQQAEWPKPPVECLGEPWSAPTKWVEQDGQLLQALADATATTDQESSRYALSCLQLRGTRGEIAATDGRQVLLQSGFTFDWEDDILVPGSKLFGYGELPRFPSIRIGRTECAAKLGFRELCVYSPQTPVICHDERRKYVWALWAPEDAIRPAAGTIKVVSPKVSRATRARNHRVRKPDRATSKRSAQNPLRIPENAIS